MSNNTAIVVKINKLEEIPGMDRIQLAKLFGTQVVVSKDVNVGDIMIYVDSNMKMSTEFLHHNNLFRHSESNIDKTQSGYFDNNGRVKCIKMRGVISDGFLFPPEYLSTVVPDLITDNLKVGEEFTKINGNVICEKYIPPRNTPGTPGSKKNRDKNTPKCKMFVEHWDTNQFMRNKHQIPADTICYIEEKIHGTSHRTGHVEVDTWKNKSWWYHLCYKLANGFKVIPGVTKWMYLNGTRRVVHMLNEDNHTYHNNSMREEVLQQCKEGKLHKGEQLYFELYGFEKTGSHIQKDFPYGCIPGQYRTTLYRVTMNNPDGKVVDYPREYVYNRAEELGFEKPHLFEKFYYSGTEYSMDKLTNKVIEYAQGQSELANDTKKEGVCIWFIDHKGCWTCLKYKDDAFRLMESKAKDSKDYVETN